MRKDSLSMQAASLAIQKHRGQKRANGTPYISHVCRVATLAEKHDKRDHFVAAAWLHDVVEDSHVKPDYIREHFGDQVYRLVMEMTNPSEHPEKRLDISREARKKMDRKHNTAASRDGRRLKLLDRIDNIRDMVSLPKKRQLRYISETKLLMKALKGTDNLLEDILSSELLKAEVSCNEEIASDVGEIPTLSS